MRTDITVVDTAGVEHDVAIDAPAGTRWHPVAQAVERAGMALGSAIYSGPVAVGADSVVGDEALHVGSVVRPEPSRPGPPSGPTLDVIGGPSAGRSLRLTGTHVVGRDSSCDLILDDPDVSRRHLAVKLRAGEVELSDLGSTHPTLVEGLALLADSPLPPGRVVQVGRSFLILRGIGTQPDPNPAPVMRRVIVPQPATPVRTRSGMGPVLVAAGVPAALAVFMAWLFSAPQMLLFALLTPASMAASAWATRLARRRDGVQAERDFRRARAAAELELAEVVGIETRTRRLASWDPVSLRRRAGADATSTSGSAVLTVGLGSARASVEVQGAEQPQLWAVPVVVDLTAPIAVQGPRELVDGLLRWLVCQFAATCDADLILVATQRPDDWHWARWLPRLTAATSVAERQEALQNLGPQSTTVLISVDDEPAPDLATLAGVRSISVDLAGRSSGRGRVVSLRDGGRVTQPDSSMSFAPTLLAPELADEIARGLACEPMTRARTLPESCRLIDVLGLDQLSPAKSVQTRWSCAPANTLRAVVGRCSDGLHVIDLDLDGPHALIAGTTGSGKSEFLKALIISLAAAYPPDEVTFVLVDYKGGAAFAECAGLPHTVGLVTDLDVATTRRALRSLGAELRRREAALAAAGAADLAAYQSADTHAPLPRLVIVVDEFAAMTTELPEFIPGLVDIAQRGRSLGLHLVLATQRPAGVVSPEIRANTQLRIALRTVTAADSIDVLDTATAADIGVNTPGRAVQRGAPHRHFQAAQVGVANLPASEAVIVTPLGPWRRLPTGTTGVLRPTDAELLGRAINQAAREVRCVPPRSPWLPALPTTVRPDDPRLATGRPVLPIGLVDLPDEQRQVPLTLDLRAGGGVLLVGGPRSGRTTGLLAVAMGAATRKSPANLEIYGIDCAGRGLASLSSLPHTGTNAVLDDCFTAIARLVDRLTALVAQRRGLRLQGDRVPLVLVLVDGWGSFTAGSEEHDLGRTSNALLALVRDAASTGVTVVVTGDRSALTPRLTSAVPTRLVLGLPDPQDYALAGVDGAQLSSALVPGRGIRTQDGAVFQLLNPSDAPVRTWSRPPNPTAIRVRQLPSAAVQPAPRPGHLCLGVGGDAVEPVWLDLSSGARLLVVGSPRSGRSTMLGSLLRQIVDAKVAVIAAAPERSPLHRHALGLGVRALTPGSNPDDVEADVLLVDDSDAFGDTPTGAALESRIRDSPDTLVVVAARSDDPSINVRGLANLVRRRRTGILLRPGPLDGELLGHRLRRDQLGGPPGRSIVIGEPAWGSGFDEPLAVQTLCDPAP